MRWQGVIKVEPYPNSRQGKYERGISVEFELINPSDPYTFIADDLETAALVVFAISPAYGAKTKEGELAVPTFIFGGADEWYAEQFGRSVIDGFEAKKKQLAEALSSMMLGHFEDRRRYEAALAAITEPDKREKFIAEWQDECSSLNDIGTRCHKLAEAITRQEAQNEERD